MDQCLTELSPKLRRIAETVRDLVRETAPELRETVKWNNPFWVGQRDVACLMLYPDHVNLGFLRGVELLGAHPELEGTGKGMRHLKLRSAMDLQGPLVRALLRDAARLDSTSR